MTRERDIFVDDTADEACAAPVRHIAVFGDLHGHLRLMFQLCRLWQSAHGVRLDGILQCGDLGYYPDPGAADKATRRFAEKDPEELGFWSYFAEQGPRNQDRLIDLALSGDSADLGAVTCPLLWCHGNHEDFDRLAQAAGGASSVAVDRFGRLFWQRSGTVGEIAGLRVGALGGAPELPDERGKPRFHQEPGPRIHSRAAAQLEGSDFDVLLTHGAPTGMDASGESTSDCARAVIDHAEPLYCFFGHHGVAIAPAEIGRTRCFWLDDVGFVSTGAFRGTLREPCMGILEWRGPEEHCFRHLTRDTEPWLAYVMEETWLHIGT